MTLGVFGALVGDNIWFQIGRYRGARVLHFLCRISLEPDTCVRRTQELFARQGARSFLWVKFVPGLGAVTTPLGGIFGMRLWRFLLFDGLGALIWASSYMALGYLFSNQLETLAVVAARLGVSLAAVLFGGLAIYILGKYLKRRSFLRQLRIARITPEEVQRKLESGEDVLIVDLRHSLEFDADPYTLPGALRIGAEELDARQEEIPRNHEIVLYCT